MCNFYYYFSHHGKVKHSATQNEKIEPDQKKFPIESIIANEFDSKKKCTTK